MKTTIIPLAARILLPMCDALGKDQLFKSVETNDKAQLSQLCALKQKVENDSLLPLLCRTNVRMLKMEMPNIQCLSKINRTKAFQ